MLIKATRENLAKVNEAVEDFLADKPISFKTRTQIDLAVEEIYINIASYAYPDSEGNAEIILSENNGEFVMTFIDEGVPYDPLAKEDPDVTLSADKRDIGGLGVFLAKQVMDEIDYERTDGQNILTMKKILA